MLPSSPTSLCKQTTNTAHSRPAMPSTGPNLPPRLSKRSRDRDDHDGASSPDSSDKRRRVAGPAPPPSSNSPDSEVGPAPLQASKPTRVMGPTLPPASLDERPPNPPSDDSDSSADDFGPAPPPAGASATFSDDSSPKPAESAFDTAAQFASAPKKAQRDEWMTMPPTQDDLAARMDPSKLRARKFNSGKSAGASGGMSSAWAETPEQKLKRLQDEAMGISTSASTSTANPESKRSKEEERRARETRRKIEASRGKSLVQEHEDRGGGKEKEDDPSKRVFNYEKDMAVSGTVNNKQRREMLNKSKGFSDRFSSGNFL